jgi:hypothetical protein
MNIISNTRPLWLVGVLALSLVACGSNTPKGSGGTFTPLSTSDGNGGDLSSSGGGVADAGDDLDAGGTGDDTSTSADTGPADIEPADTGTPDTGPATPVDVAGEQDTGPVNVKPCTFDAFIGATGLECGGALVCVGNQGQCKGKVQGICKPKIVQCPKIKSPVCGCNDQTFDNACIPQKDGVTIKHGGKCGGAPTACGGTTGVICPADFVCDVTSCDKTASGLCIAQPQGQCPPGGIPECGCDGQEYANACVRLKAKVPLMQKGSCPTTGTIACKIGPAGKILKPCPDGQFCKLNLNNPIPCTGDGTCAIIPKSCDPAKNEVCGCNFQTYNNACELAKAAISLKGSGQCGGNAGGCTEGKNECPVGTYCGVQQGKCGDKGICINKPPAAQCTPDVKLVCGCDGKTHSNAGCAATKGVIVKFSGKCP